MSPNLQDKLQALLDRFVERGKEHGVQVAVYHDGRLVVDAAAGGMTARGEEPVVEKSTLFPVFSTTKGVAATLAHLVVERGLIGYDTPIAKVWPEFAAHGKGGVTFGHALDHTAGVPILPAGLDHERLGDWEAMCAAVADAKPIASPGARKEYHPISYSWTVGEVIRRVDGRPFPQILREEIANPLGVADEMFCGLPDAEQARVATLAMEPAEPPPGPDPQPAPAFMQPLWRWMNRADARRACVPGANGVMSARAVARHYAALLPGGIDGVELLPPARVRLATAPRPTGSPDDGSAQQALGYGLGGFTPACFGHGGYGGSQGWADPENRLAFGFTRNFFSPHDPLAPIYAELRNHLGL
jgi:CubicO group peptidase (beta-lactamase class C family)